MAVARRSVIHPAIGVVYAAGLSFDCESAWYWRTCQLLTGSCSQEGATGLLVGARWLVHGHPTSYPRCNAPYSSQQQHSRALLQLHSCTSIQ